MTQRPGPRFAVLVLILAGLVAAGCAESKDRLRVRAGLLTVGLDQNAFLAEWGPPERTASATSEEQLQARWGGAPFSGGFFKGKRPLDVWSYERHGVELVFDDGDLVAWRTDKTVEQLRAIPARKP